MVLSLLLFFFFLFFSLFVKEYDVELNEECPEESNREIFKVDGYEMFYVMVKVTVKMA